MSSPIELPSLTDWLGYLAALLTTLAFLPQVIRIWRTRSARDVSLPTFLMFTSGVALWLAYGIALGVWPIILANTLTLVFSAAILVMKLRFG
jgi:MtN3 and saliva related transmembrane protein